MEFFSSSQLQNHNKPQHIFNDFEAQNTQGQIKIGMNTHQQNWRVLEEDK